MKRIIKSGFICMLIFACFCMTGYAANNDYSLTYGGGDADIIISGTAKESMGNRQVTLQIIKEGKSIADLYPPSSLSAEEVILYTKQLMTDEKGMFAFSFKVDVQGKHTVRISDNGELLVGQTSFYRSTQEELNDALAQLNTAVGNPSGIDAVINGESTVAPNARLSEILQLDMAKYSSYKTDTAFLTNLSARTYSSVEDFRNQYALSAFYVELSRASSADDVKKLLEGNTGKQITFTGKNAGVVFAEYQDADKVSVYSKMTGKHYAGESDVKDALYEAVIVKEIADKTTYQAKFAAMELNNDVLLLNIAGCSSLGTYVEQFKDELGKADLSDIAKIKSSFSTLYNKYLLLNQQGGDDDGGGNGGGGGGGNRYANVDNELIIDNENKPAASFTDLSSVEWAREAIESLAEKGVIQGKATSIFAPNDSITRTEFVKILMGAFEMVDESAQAAFSDVSKSHWGYKYVATAVSKGIVNGIGDGSFGVNSQITRQDIVTLCYRLAESMEVKFPADTESEFADSEAIADYAKMAAKQMKAAGIVNGKGDNMFAPSSFATRAEAAKIIYELINFCRK